MRNSSDSVELLSNYLPDKEVVEDLLQSFQGAVLAYLISGDAERGKRMLARLSKDLVRTEELLVLGSVRGGTLKSSHR